MTSRFADAHQEIRAILQRSPNLTAKMIWNELTDSYPIPSERTIQRVMQGLNRELAFDKNLAVSPRKRKAISATVKLTEGFSSKEFSMASPDEKLDAIAAHLDSLHKRFDSIESERKADKARLDAIEAEHGKLRADAEAEKEKADKARADAAAAAGPRADASVENRNVFASHQMKLDAGCQAWGYQATAPLHAEKLRDYRVRILSTLKAHSKTYKDSDLGSIGDEAAFSLIEDRIINDAIAASTTTVEAGQPLRKVESRNAAGHQVVKFYGDPAVTWGQYMGGATRWGKLVRLPTSNR